MSEPMARSAPSDSRPIGLGPDERDVVAGRYRLLSLIAHGGMGSVYRAEHLLSRKKMALKVVHPYLCKGPQGVERFRREVSAAATIEHPGIVQVYDAGTDDDGGFFMAMELLEGESLGDRMRNDWPGLAASVRIVEGVLAPLAKAHERGFVHRDLKPDNIFLAIDPDSRQSRIKILDFGLARDAAPSSTTRTGITFGTPEYMSPEQAVSARKVKAPGDVWSMGVILYELLGGRHPFSGETPNAVMANAIKEAHVPLRELSPYVPAPIAQVVERSLMKRPEDRPPDAGALLAELQSARAVVGELSDDKPNDPEIPSWRFDDDEEEIAETAPPLDEQLEDQPTAPHPQLKPTIDGNAEAVAVDPHPVPPAAPDLSVTPTSAQRAPIKRRPVALLAGLAVALAGGLAALLIGYALTRDEGLETQASGPAAAALPPPIESSVPDNVVEPGTPGAETDEVPTEMASQPEVQPEVQPGVRDSEEPVDLRERVRPEGPRSASNRERQIQLEVARNCVRQTGNYECAVRVLRGRARSPEERIVLIDAYRFTGRQREMLREQRRFVARFPRHSRSLEYRRAIRRAGAHP